MATDCDMASASDRAVCRGLALAACSGDAATAAMFDAEAERAAAELIGEHWHGMTALACELFIRRRIDGARIRQIVRDAERAARPRP